MCRLSSLRFLLLPVLSVATISASVLLLCPAPAHAQGGVPLWTKQPGGESIAVDSSGNAFVTGFSSGTIKYSALGIPLWTNLPGGLAIAVDNKGNVFVAFSAPAGDPAPGTRAYSNDGIPLWTNYDRGSAIAVDSHGNVFVSGSSVGSGTSWYYETIKYSSAGLPLWTNRYDGAGEFNQDYAHAMAVDSNGNVFVTGQSGSSGNAHDYATIGYSSDGVLLWTARYSGPGSYHSAQAIAVDSDGNVFVTGSSSGADDFQYAAATIKYSGEGMPLWTNRYVRPGAAGNYAFGIAVDGNGNVFVTGHSWFQANGNDYATIKYSNAGAQLWTRHYSGPPGNTFDYAQAIALDRSGNVIVTGTSFQTDSGGSNQYATVAYSGAGVTLWTNRHEGASTGFRLEAKPIALDNIGNVFVTGSPVTTKYSSSVPPPRLDFQLLNNQLVLSWTNAGLTLETAPFVAGPFTNVPSATSPYPTPFIGPQQFFRLKGY